MFDGKGDVDDEGVLLEQTDQEGAALVGELVGREEDAEELLDGPGLEAEWAMGYLM